MSIKSELKLPETITKYPKLYKTRYDENSMVVLALDETRGIVVSGNGHREVGEIDNNFTAFTDTSVWKNFHQDQLLY